MTQNTKLRNLDRLSPPNKLTRAGMKHMHRVAMQSLRMSFPGQQRYIDAVLVVYLVEECLQERCNPTIGDSVRRRYPRQMFAELDPPRGTQLRRA